jgi:hypothetical protein
MCCTKFWRGITCYNSEAVSVVERYITIGLVLSHPYVFLFCAVALRLLTLNTCHACRCSDYQRARLNFIMQWGSRSGFVFHGFHP